jgi:hypothetical protein
MYEWKENVLENNAIILEETILKIISEKILEICSLPKHFF